MKYTCILLAAGSGQRMNLGYNKVLYRLDSGKTIVEQAITCFDNDQDCAEIIVVANEDLNLQNYQKVSYAKGGNTRMNSVYNGLLKSKCEYVVIHDAARPFLKKEHLEKLKIQLKKTDACILAVKAKDTIKLVKNLKIEKTLDRESIYLAQTPQCFKKELLLKAYQNCDFNVTDDSSLLEHLGYEVTIVEGDYSNIKITFPEDLKPKEKQC